MGHQSSKHSDRRGSVPVQNTTLRPLGILPARSDLSINVQKYDLSTFAVIAVIFNPVGYKSRYSHYQQFEKHMAQSGVVLYTIECIFDSAEHFGLPRQRFEVTRAGDHRHTQVTAPSIIWMKENLINVAIARLPQHIEYIAWIDADIEFDHLDWPHRAIAELQRYAIVQLFELSYFLGPGGKSEVLRRDYSFGYSIRHNKPINPQRSDGWYAHPGYAWAIRRSALASIGGFLDFCIIGSGDLHFAFALLNRIEDTIRPGLHPDYRQLACVWGQRVAQLAQNGANVSYIPVNLWHHWHGERNDRNYVDRWAILEKHHFSPVNDLEKNDDTGLIRLTNKARSKQRELISRMEALERDIVAYFKSRNEDSTARTVPKPRQPIPAARQQPATSGKSHPHRGGGMKPSTKPSGASRGSRGPHIWTSGPAGTHVDDCHPYSNHCTCHGHHHPDNHDCPCAPHHMDDQHCWDPSENEYHHHGVDDHHSGHHSSHDHDHHGGADHGHSSGGGWDHGHSSGGGGHHNTDYGGPGSFY